MLHTVSSVFDMPRLHLMAEPSLKDIIADYVNYCIENSGLSLNKLAEESGLSPATIHRAAGRDPKYSATPKTSTVLALYRVTGLPLPDRLRSLATGAATGFAERELEPILPPEDDTDPNLQRWQIRTTSMQLMGYMPGDIVIADTRVTPRDGDVVVAQVYDHDLGSAETVIRFYKMPYILNATSNPAEFEAHLVEHRNVVIVAVVISSHRTRAAA